MTPTTATAVSWARFYAAAKRDGLPEAFRLLHDAVCLRALPFGPGGHALVPLEVARTATHSWVGGRVGDRAAGTETTMATHRVGDAVFVALKRRSTATSVDTPPVPHRAWSFGLAWLRLGLSERLLESCHAYLATRFVDNAPLLHQQLVKGTLADAVIGHLEVRAALADAEPDEPGLTKAVVADLHRRITDTDWLLVGLLGAGGFLTDGPGHTAWLSELLADVYVDSADTWRDDGDRT